jgi:hypothetical protein
MSDKAIRKVEKAILREYNHVLRILATRQYAVRDIQHKDVINVGGNDINRRWKSIEFVVIRQKDFPYEVTLRTHKRSHKYYDRRKKTL